MDTLHLLRTQLTKSDHNKFYLSKLPSEQFFHHLGQPYIKIMVLTTTTVPVHQCSQRLDIS